MPLEEHPGQRAVNTTAAESPSNIAKSNVRWGILGPGYIAGIFAEDLARTPGAELVSVASRSAGRAEEFARSHGADRSYGSYAALGDDPEVDIVYIASPHSHHFEHAKLMLESGKPVLVEKPFTMNAGQAEELVALAHERGLFLMEAVWTLCNPFMRDLISRVRDDRIGQPTSFSASIGPIGGIPSGHRVEDPDQGGSFLLECLVYPLSILAALAPDLADANTVSAVTVTTDRGVDVSASVTLSSHTGIATLSGGFVIGAAGAGTSTFQLIGSDGWLQVDDNLFNPGHAAFSSLGIKTELESSAHEQGYVPEIEEASRCVREGRRESDLVPLSQTVHVMRLLDRARESAGIEVTA